MGDVGVGSVVRYEVPDNMQEYLGPDGNGCCAAIIAGMSEESEEGEKKANLWIYPNVTGVSPMMRMGVKEGLGADTWHFPKKGGQLFGEYPNPVKSKSESRSSKKRNDDK